MRLAYRLSFSQESMHWAIAEVVVLAACLGGLRCLVDFLKGPSPEGTTAEVVDQRWEATRPNGSANAGFSSGRVIARYWADFTPKHRLGEMSTGF
jgi:hypothetical protein